VLRRIRGVFVALTTPLILVVFGLEGDWAAFVVVLVGGLVVTGALMLWSRNDPDCGLNPVGDERAVNTGMYGSATPLVQAGDDDVDIAIGDLVGGELTVARVPLVGPVAG
jgi:hypothetical protein